MHSVEGVVVDTNNDPVSNVWVRIYREGAEGNSDTTTDGNYKLEYESGSPILIRYDHMLVDSHKRRHPTIVHSISGAADHRIDKVMPDVVMHAHDKCEFLEILSAYEHFYVDVAGKGLRGFEEELFDRYAENIGWLKWIDEITEQRIKHVVGLYQKKPE